MSGFVQTVVGAVVNVREGYADAVFPSKHGTYFSFEVNGCDTQFEVFDNSSSIKVLATCNQPVPPSFRTAEQFAAIKSVVEVHARERTPITVTYIDGITIVDIS